MNPVAHDRRSIRLKGYDYAQAGAYFMTVCAHERRCVFGDVVDGEMRLNDAGCIVRTVWDALPEHYPHVQLDEFVIMPNHIHGIIVLSDVGAGLKPAPTLEKRHGLPEIVRAFKSFSARRINESCRTRGIPVWQRNYYEHVIRNDDDLNDIRSYIAANPAGWAADEYHVADAGLVDVRRISNPGSRFPS
ncbi:MAG: transposase [Planctomycetota bacterium]